MRRFGKTSTAMASGWMTVRGARRRRAFDRGFVISDHVDWPSMLKAIQLSEPEEVWVTHGREEALVRQLELMGRRGRALALIGREDEAE